MLAGQACLRAGVACAPQGGNDRQAGLVADAKSDFFGLIEVAMNEPASMQRDRHQGPIFRKGDCKPRVAMKCLRRKLAKLMSQVQRALVFELMDEIERARVLEHCRPRKFEREGNSAAIRALEGMVDDPLIGHAAGLAKWFDDAREIAGAGFAQRMMAVQPRTTQSAIGRIKQIDHARAESAARMAEPIADRADVHRHVHQDGTEMCSLQADARPICFPLLKRVLLLILNA